MALVFLATLSSCASQPLEGRPCPCLEGWTCCGARSVCVREGAICPDDWVEEPSRSGSTLQAVCASGPTDVYVVGGEILRSHGDGAWASEDLPLLVTAEGRFLAAVWASGADDVYAVGLKGTIVHSVGDGVWREQTSGTRAHLLGVWGSGRGDVYVVGAGGTILHSRGDGRWTALASGTTQSLVGITGSGANAVTVVGEHTLLRSTGDGTFAAAIDGPVSTHTLVSAVATPSGELYVAGYDDEDLGDVFYWRGAAGWSTVFHAATRMLGVWAGAADVYAVGDADVIARGSPMASTGWERQHHAKSLDGYGVGGTATSTWAVGADGVILRRVVP